MKNSKALIAAKQQKEDDRVKNTQRVILLSTDFQ